MKYIVFGLGNFGNSLATQLTTLGHEVIGVDKNMAKVERLRDKITHTVCMDCTDRDAVSALPLKDSDAVIVAIGEDEASSLLSTALLKQLKVKRIIGRIMSDLQQTVLEAMDIDEYIMPEVDSAERLAMRLNNSEIIEFFKISDKHSIVEALVPERYVGQTLGEANITNEYRVLVLTTLRPKDSSEISAENTSAELAQSSTLLQKDDILVLFGELKDINRLIT
ncbi:TrkA family potassium uptake protein [Olivibacter ginsenosidimutans]|uniref:TrkA family potassium uptake protein n=1 Tax=Olivibacter ginsenosidimutans TaxID=1176537 RepID=A0ABP9CGR3_9SPHI